MLSTVRPVSQMPEPCVFPHSSRELRLSASRPGVLDSRRVISMEGSCGAGAVETARRGRRQQHDAWTDAVTNHRLRLATTFARPPSTTVKSKNGFRWSPSNLAQNNNTAECSTPCCHTHHVQTPFDHVA